MSCIGGGIIRAARILVIESDEILAIRVVAALEGAGYTVVRAADHHEGITRLYETYPDVIIAGSELMMVNGEETYLRIRKASYLPIIVIGSREEAAEVLELGADAFVTKPPSLSEVVARVNRLLQRKPGFDPSGNNPGLDLENEIQDNGNGLSLLSTTEFRLASCLVLNKGTLMAYPQLIGEVWGGKMIGVDTLHYYMRRLRQKLQDYFPQRINIVNWRGVGYRLEVEASS